MAEKRLKYTAEQIDSAIEKVKNMPSEGIVGPQGPIGETGATGAAGKDGKEIELQKTSSYIQWRYVGDSWNNLVALADLKGDKGDKGDGANVDLNDYALKSWVNEQIAKVQSGGSVDLSSYYTKTEVDTKISSKANISDLHNHSNKSILDNITSSKINEWDNKSTLALGTSSSTAFRGDYGNTAYTHSQSLHAPANAEANVQADWNVSDISSDAYIKNKPVIPVAYDDSEIRSSLEHLESEVNELKEGNIDIDLTNYVTKSELSSKADKTELHSHSNKDVLDGITTNKITEWNNKSNFSGNYNDLTNKPTIPTKVSELTNDEGYLTTVPSEYITETELNSKGYLTQHQDISGKVDKVNGYSLVSDAEISRLATLENYNDTEVRELINETNTSLDNLESEVNDLKEGNINIDLTNYATKDYVEDAINNAKLEGGDVQVDLSSYAKKTDLHSHSNKSVLDNITTSKISEWNNKSTFSGNYNDLTNKPTIPTKTSELTNNSGFITSIPSEYVTETELSSHTSNTTAHITASERNNWNNKSNFDGNYNSLTNKPTSLPANGGNASTVGGYSLWVGTQAQYNAIATKSDTTVYIIKEE